MKIELNGADTEPVLFCSKQCLGSYEKGNVTNNPDSGDPQEVRLLVQNLIEQTKKIQNELENLKKVRTTYFGLFKDHDLKDEVYKRKWSFDKKENY